MQASLFDSCKGYVLAHANRPSLHQKELLPSIAISREAGAGAVTVGEKVIELMQKGRQNQAPWALFDRNLIEQVLEDHNLPKRIKEFMPEAPRFELSAAVEEMLGLHPGSWTLLEHTTDTILRLASTGHAILVGRGANIITAHLPNVLQVRLVAPEKQRIRHCEKYYSLTEREATLFVHKTDRARRHYVKRYFNADVDDPLHYHLIVNTGLFSYEEAAQVIATAARFHVSQMAHAA